MRAWSLPIRQSQIAALLVVGLLASGSGLGLLWATNALEGKWLIAAAAAFGVVGLAVVSGHVERFLLGCLFLVIPFNADVQWSPVSVPVGAKPLELSAIDLILGCLYAGWIVRVVRDRQSFTAIWPPGATALGGLIGWAALSMANARDPRLSLLLLVGFVKALLCFVYLANHVKTRDALWLVARCLMVGLVVESLIACGQHVTGDTLGLSALGERAELYNKSWMGAGTISRVVGTFGHPNALGGYLVSVLPLALVLNMAALRLSVRLVLAGAFLLGSVVLVITLNRSAWLSMAASGVFLIWWLLRNRPMRVRVAPLLLIILVACILLAPFAPLVMARWIEYDHGAAASRLHMMHVAWSTITSHPLLGVGLNNYTSVMHLYDTTMEGIAFHYPRPVHNIYLLLAAEAGLPTLVWLGWFLWTTISRAWQRLAATTDELTRLIVLGITLGFLAKLVDGLVQFRYLGTDPLFWIYPALLVASWRQQANE